MPRRARDQRVVHALSASMSVAGPASDFSFASRSSTRRPKPPGRKFTPSLTGMKTGTRPAVPMPPKHEWASAMNTVAPWLRAATAAAVPAGPPPATKTSTSYLIRSFRWKTTSPCAVAAVSPAMARLAASVPAAIKPVAFSQARLLNSAFIRPPLKGFNTHKKITSLHVSYVHDLSQAAH